MELSNWKSNDWHPLWLNWNSISYRIFVLLPLIVTTIVTYILYVLNSTFPFLVLVKRKKKMSFWSTRKIHFLKFKENFVETSQILIWKLSDGQIGLVHTANLSDISCTFISCYIYTLKPRPFKFLPAFRRTFVCRCNGNFDL